MQDLPVLTDPNLIAGIEHFEDAGVYRLRDDLALIQTVDFFTPIVDEPGIFGRVAAANALSDVYAMGGKPLTAMNIICFPIKTMDVSILRDILLGGLDKLREAAVVLVGGHSVDDNELKYGLSVSGIVHPDRVLLNNGARPGDKLVLTKALGTGIVSTAIKEEAAPPELEALSIESMMTLNRVASVLMTETPGVHACTDITGFGFLGHACEMAEASGTGMIIHRETSPFSRECAILSKRDSCPEGCTATGNTECLSLKYCHPVQGGSWISFLRSADLRGPSDFRFRSKRGHAAGEAARCGRGLRGQGWRGGEGSGRENIR